MHQHPVFTHEIGVEVGDGEIVGSVFAVGGGDLGDGHELIRAVVAAAHDGHADGQVFGDPPLTRSVSPDDPPRVIVGGFEDLRRAIFA